MHTVQWLMEDLGDAAAAFHDQAVRGLRCSALEVDEMHSYVGVREENISHEMRGAPGRGTHYTWIALDAASRFIPTWHIGRRETSDAVVFMHDLAERIEDIHRVQISSDGFQAYLPAVQNAFGSDANYAQLIKILEEGLESVTAKKWLEERPGAKLKATRKISVFGSPDMSKVSTAYVERMNSTIRMSLRRYMRMTHGFSKKVENHKRMTALFHVWYNYCRSHQSIETTPAVKVGLTNHRWSDAELLRTLGCA